MLSFFLGRTPSSQSRRRLNFDLLEDRLAPAVLSETAHLLPTVEIGDTVHDGDDMGQSVDIDGDTAVVGAIHDNRAEDNIGEGVGAVSVYVRTAGAWTLQQRLVPEDAVIGTNFGYSVAVSGDRLIVGTQHVGEAYVFHRVNGVWSQEQKIVPETSHIIFGVSVDIAGDTLVMGEGSGAYVYVLNGESWTQQQKLLARENGIDQNYFPNAVAIDGDTIVAGRSSHAFFPSTPDAAYVYVRSGTVWTQQQKLTPTDAGAGNYFGESVAVDGDTVVVGSPRLDSSSPYAPDAGAAYVFTRSLGAWTQDQILTASDLNVNAYFGESVAIDGNTIVAGAPSNELTLIGAAYVFTNVSGDWQQQQKLTASDATTPNLFGTGVAISGDTAVIGAPALLGGGAAYFYDRSGMTWGSETKFAPQGDDARDDQFGNSVAIQGNIAVVGAYQDNIHGVNSGAVYIYQKTGDNWALLQKLTPDDAVVRQDFGYSVAIDGNTIIVSAPDSYPYADFPAVYVFVRNGSHWDQQQKLISPQVSAFASTIAIAGDTIVVGAPSTDVGGRFASGLVQVYHRAGTVWSLTQTLVPADAADMDYFGSAVAIDGNTIAVGAELKANSSGKSLGAAYSFAWNGTRWVQKQEILCPTPARGNAAFGSSIDLADDTLVVGAPGPSFARDGAVYVFSRTAGVWDLQQKLRPTTTSTDTNFGYSVSTNGDTIVASAAVDRATTLAGISAAAFVFDRTGGHWNQRQVLPPSGEPKLARSPALLGIQVAISGDLVIAGSAGEDTAVGRDSGAVAIYAPAPPRTGLLVDEAGDVVDGDTSAGHLSLREAINFANSTPGPDTITFAADLGPIDLTQGTLEISDSSGVTKILGSLFGSQIVRRKSGGSDFGVFTVDADVTVELQNLTISNGNALAGGGLTNSGTTSLISCTVSDNTATGDGGGLLNLAGRLTVTRSTIAGNQADRGGAISNFAQFEVNNSTVSGNFATTQAGGGIFNGAAASLSLVNATVVLNRASAAAGGGVALGSADNVVLLNSIVAGNLTGTIANDIDVADASLLSNASTNNLIGDAASAAGLVDAVGGNIVGVSGVGTRDLATILNPVLASNGGPTQTHALVENSVALNAGSVQVANFSSFDQRGAARDSVPDLGAYEVHHPLAPVGVPVDIDDVFAPNSSDTTNEAFLRGLYHDTLLREPDAGGLAYWLGVANSGTSRTQIAYGFVNSPENRTNQVTYFYEYFLGREPDAGGLAYWVGQLQSGVSEATVMTRFILSPEFSGQNDNASFTNLMYFALLGRQADAGGFNYWLDSLNSGAKTRDQAVDEFLFSPEGLDRIINNDYLVYLKRPADQPGLTYFSGRLNQGMTFGRFAALLLGSDEFDGLAADHQDLIQ